MGAPTGGTSYQWAEVNSSTNFNTPAAPTLPAGHNNMQPFVVVTKIIKT
jgi:hypothetical protein